MFHVIPVLKMSVHVTYIVFSLSNWERERFLKLVYSIPSEKNVLASPYWRKRSLILCKPSHWIRKVISLKYRVSQKFVPLLYKSVTQYDWTWSAHNLNQSCDFQSNLIFILLVPSFDSKFDLCNFAPKVRCASKFSRHIFFAFCSPKCSNS